MSEQATKREREREVEGGGGGGGNIALTNTLVFLSAIADYNPVNQNR